MPLLNPARENLPFGVALELWDGDTSWRAGKSGANQELKSSELYEVDYVLYGKGKLVSTDGEIESLNAGDSVILPYGHAWCEARRQQELAEDIGTNYFHFFDWHMVLLKLVLPTDLLLAEGVRQDFTSVSSSVAHACEDWFSSGKKSGKFTHQEVGDLLTGLQDIARLAGKVNSKDAMVQRLGSMGDRCQEGSMVPSVQSMSEAKDGCGTFANRFNVRSRKDKMSGESTPNESSSFLGEEACYPSNSSARIASSSDQYRGVQEWFFGNIAELGAFSFIKNLLDSVKTWRASPYRPPQTIVTPQCHAADLHTVSKRSLKDLHAFQLPNQTNRLALMFDPTEENIPFTFGLEIFEPNHRTKPHTHNTAHELFFVLSGEGQAFCNGHHFPVGAGDIVVFPPTTLHGIDNGPFSKMYCLEMMLPNEMFAEFVKMGRPTGGLDNDDMCALVALGCGSD